MTGDTARRHGVAIVGSDSVSTQQGIDALQSGQSPHGQTHIQWGGLEDKDEAHHQQVTAATQACKDALVFHWPLAFPQVFASGGFDCLLGNPPWEMLQLDPQEFFATRAPEIANAQHMAARDKMIEQLRRDNPVLHAAYMGEVRRTEASQAFVHFSGRFPTSGFGRLNLAYLFAELFLDLKRSGGRSGVVVPSGIATDSFSQHLFNKIADGNLVSFYDIENRSKLFEAVDSRMKFCLLTMGQTEESSFACFLTSVNQIADTRRVFRLSSSDFELLNPNTGTCPVFRTNQDAELTKKIYRTVPVLWREATEDAPEVNPWGLKFMLMFMMNTDSNKFSNHPEPGTLPLFEAKLIRQHGQIKRAEVMELCRLTEGQVKRLLQRMLAAGQIVMRGQGKNTANVEPE